MEPRATAKPSRALEGEDLKTSHWEDARHWMSIYDDLLEFKRGILDRVKRDLEGLQPLARKAAAEDVQIIEDQMQGYQARLDLWYRFRARQTESAPIDTMRLTELRLGPVSKEVLR